MLWLRNSEWRLAEEEIKKMNWPVPSFNKTTLLTNLLTVPWDLKVAGSQVLVEIASTRQSCCIVQIDHVWVTVESPFLAVVPVYLRSQVGELKSQLEKRILVKTPTTRMNMCHETSELGQCDIIYIWMDNYDGMKACWGNIHELLFLARVMN